MVIVKFQLKILITSSSELKSILHIEHVNTTLMTRTSLQGTAWRELNQQFELRTRLLQDAVQFYTFTDKVCLKTSINTTTSLLQHDEYARKMERELRIGSEYTANADMLQKWLKDMQQLRKGLST